MTPDAQALVERVRAGRLPSPYQRKLIREKAGVSQRDMAAALDVHAMTLNRWENGVKQPRPDHAIAYVELLTQLRDAAK